MNDEGVRIRASLGRERVWALEEVQWAKGTVHQSWLWGLCDLGDQVEEVCFNGGKGGMAGDREGIAGNLPPQVTDVNTQAYLSSHR